MGNIGERIKWIRETKNLKQVPFCEELGINRSNLAAYETDRTVPSNSVITLICRTYNVNEAWLRTGEGEPFAEKPLVEEIKSFLDGLSYNDVFKTQLLGCLVKMTPDEWGLLEKMVRKLAKLDEVSELESKSVSELEEIYKNQNLSQPSGTEPSASNTTEGTETA